MSIRDSTPLISWRPNPPRDGRGTYDIITLCASTLVICSWSAVHVDVLKRRTFWRTHGSRIFWFVIGMFMPELLLSFAIGQFLKAREITRFAHDVLGLPRPLPWWRGWRSCSAIAHDDVIAPKSDNAKNEQSDLLHTDSGKSSRRHAWTMTHSFFALMGGFPEVDPDAFLDVNESAIEKCPDVSLEEIMDRSKSGPLSKAILCAQIVFFCANCFARINQNLTLSLLEITTIAHSLCALCAYVAWWDKPQDVGGEAPLRFDTLVHYFAVAVFGHFNNQHDNNIGSLLPTAVFISVIYGTPHLLGFHVSFPSSPERVLWLVSSGLVISCMTLFVLITPVLDIVDKRGCNTLGTVLVLLWLLLPVLYTASSAFLVCESVRQLFALPETAFSQPEWTQYIPHFS